MTHLDRTISNNLAILLSTVSGIRDGKVDAIHAARVATRRLRAALPLAWAESPRREWRDGATAVRRLGRDLGRVREVDVALEQLSALEARVPTAAPSIAVIRQQLTERQARQYRRLVKDVEAASLDQLQPNELVPPRRVSLRADRRSRFVERAMVDRAGRLRHAIDHASGVYFPNRAHRVRVETKKLRYVVELMSDAPPARVAVKQLKRIQKVLGDLHDHQMLIDMLRSEKVIGRSERDVLIASLDARCNELFREYVSRRASLVDLCEEIRTAASLGDWRPHSVGGVLLKASVVAAPSVLLWLTRPPAHARVHARQPSKRVEDRSDERQMAPPVSVTS